MDFRVWAFAFFSGMKLGELWKLGMIYTHQRCATVAYTRDIGKWARNLDLLFMYALNRIAWVLGWFAHCRRTSRWLFYCSIQMNEHAAEVETKTRTDTHCQIRNRYVQLREMECVKNLRCRLNNNTNSWNDDSFFSLSLSLFASIFQWNVFQSNCAEWLWLLVKE